MIGERRGDVRLDGMREKRGCETRWQEREEGV